MVPVLFRSANVFEIAAPVRDANRRKFSVVTHMWRSYVGRVWGGGLISMVGRVALPSPFVLAPDSGGSPTKMESSNIVIDKKLSYRRGTARCVVSIEILPIATQQCRNYLYDKP